MPHKNVFTCQGKNSSSSLRSAPEIGQPSSELGPCSQSAFSSFHITPSPSPSPPCHASVMLPHSRFPFGLQRFIFLLLVSMCFLPCPAGAAVFRVGVVGPWGCDPLFAKALPSVAAQLAVNRINRDASLSYASTFDYSVLQVGPHICCSLLMNLFLGKSSIAVPHRTIHTVSLQEPCETSRALEKFVGFHTKASAYIGPSNPGYCDAASMLSKGWNKVKACKDCFDSLEAD